jgi:hypothetical protein
MASILEWSDPHTEQVLLGELSLQEPWALIEHFSSLVRESGTEDERRAAAYVSGRLEALGIPHQVHTPTLYISLPRGAGLTVLAPQQRTLHAKTPSFSVSTGDTPVQGSLVYLPSGFAQSDAALFEGGVRATAADCGQDRPDRGFAHAAQGSRPGQSRRRWRHLHQPR